MVITLFVKIKTITRDRNASYFRNINLVGPFKYIIVSVAMEKSITKKIEC